MKTSKNFQKTIEGYLRSRGDINLDKEGKSIEECCSYICEQVKKMGVCGLADEEVFNLAVHYYDEDDIKVEGNYSNMNVVVNHHIELSEEEKEEARKQAFEEVKRRQMNKITSRPQKPVKQAVKKEEQLSLF